MTDIRFVVPVVAHRIFGLRIRERKIRIPPDIRGLPRVAGLDGPEGPPRRSIEAGEDIDRTIRLLPEVDYEHGSTLSVEEIRAIFDADPAVAGSEGFTVNTVWEATGIRFALLAVVDDVVDSHVADYLPRDARLSRPVVDPVVSRGRVHRDAVHLLFFRELEGRRGEGYGGDKQLAPFVLMPDFTCSGDEDSSRCWRRWIVITAHELGHVLKLPHMPQTTNLMWWAAGDESGELTRPQHRVSEEAASHFRAPSDIPFPAPHHPVDPGSMPILFP